MHMALFARTFFVNSLSSFVFKWFEGFNSVCNVFWFLESWLSLSVVDSGVALILKQYEDSIFEDIHLSYLQKC